MLALENGQKDFYHQLLERLVPEDHVYRKLERLLDFKERLKSLHDLYSHTGRPSERQLHDSNSARWFCGYGL